MDTLFDKNDFIDPAVLLEKRIASRKGNKNQLGHPFIHEIQQMSLIDLIGTDFKTYSKYIEEKFDPTMNWHEPNSFQIDHVKPLSRALNLEEYLLWWNYKNTEPITMSQNRRKHNRFNFELYLLENHIIENHSDNGKESIYSKIPHEVGLGMYSPKMRPYFYGYLLSTTLERVIKNDKYPHQDPGFTSYYGKEGFTLEVATEKEIRFWHKKLQDVFHDFYENQDKYSERRKLLSNMYTVDKSIINDWVNDNYWSPLK